MIVVCTSCRARFRIADEKVGARGVRIRCSKCKNAFVVAPGAPRTEDPGPAEGRAPPSLPAPDGATSAPPQAGLAEADPFAAFFAGSGAAASEGAPVPDPSPEPAAEPANGSTTADLPKFLGSLPVTNLADLEKTGARLVAPAAAAEAQAASPGGDGLSLEERTPVGIPVFEPGGVSAPAGDPFGADISFPEPVSDPGADMPMPMPDPDPGFDFGPPVNFDPGPTEMEKDLAVEPAPSLEVESPPPPPLPAPRAAPRAAPPVDDGGGGAASRGEEPAPVEADTFGGARLRGVFVNALSLALLLVFTAGILIWWRGESVLALARRATHPTTAPLSALASENGYFETSSGRLLVFLRGDVRSQRTVPVGRVRVRAEMVQAGRVVARAEGLAGAVPTPEELAAVSSREDAEKLGSALEGRAPRQIAPGQQAPFLLTFVDYPANMGDVTFRVAADLAGP